MTLTEEMFETGEFPIDWHVELDRRVTVKYRNTADPKKLADELIMQRFFVPGLRDKLPPEPNVDLEWEVWFILPHGMSRQNWHAKEGGFLREGTKQGIPKEELYRREDAFDRLNRIWALGPVQETLNTFARQWVWTKPIVNHVAVATTLPLERADPTKYEDPAELQKKLEEEGTQQITFQLVAQELRISLKGDERRWTITNAGIEPMTGEYGMNVLDSRPTHMRDGWLDELNQHASFVHGPR